MNEIREFIINNRTSVVLVSSFIGTSILVNYVAHKVGSKELVDKLEFYVDNGVMLIEQNLKMTQEGSDFVKIFNGHSVLKLYTMIMKNDMAKYRIANNDQSSHSLLKIIQNTSQIIYLKNLETESSPEERQALISRMFSNQIMSFSILLLNSLIPYYTKIEYIPIKELIELIEDVQTPLPISIQLAGTLAQLVIKRKDVRVEMINHGALNALDELIQIYGDNGLDNNLFKAQYLLVTTAIRSNDPELDQSAIDSDVVDRYSSSRWKAGIPNFIRPTKLIPVVSMIAWSMVYGKFRNQTVQMSALSGVGSLVLPSIHSSIYHQFQRRINTSRSLFILDSIDMSISLSCLFLLNRITTNNYVLMYMSGVYLTSLYTLYIDNNNQKHLSNYFFRSDLN